MYQPSELAHRPESNYYHSASVWIQELGPERVHTLLYATQLRVAERGMLTGSGELRVEFHAKMFELSPQEEAVGRKR